MRATPAPAWDSGNTTVWEERIDITFVVANTLILFITSVVGIAANVFVLLAVYHQKSLQTSNNALVVNLAVVDILRCVIDCPILLAIVMTVHQRGQVDTSICDTQVASFAFSCCIQLLTLACISAERYQAIAQPFKTSQRRKRIMVLIPLTWTLAILVAVLCLMFVKDSPVNVRCKGLQREAMSSYDTFGLYMLLPLWAACFSVITGFYARIFTLVRSHNRKIFDKGISHLSKKDQTENTQEKEEAVKTGQSEQKQNLSKSVAQVVLVTQNELNLTKKDSFTALLASSEPPHCVSIHSENNKERNKVEITHSETQLCLFAVKTEEKAFKTEQPNPFVTKDEAESSNGGDAASVKSSAAKPQKVSNNLHAENPSSDRVKADKAPTAIKETTPHVSSVAQSENPKSSSVLLIEPQQASNGNRAETLAAAALDQVSSLPPVSSCAPETEAAKQTVLVEGAVCMMPSKASRQRANKNKESKMAKRAGYIIITFLLFWLPLITTILVNFALYKINSTQVSVVQLKTHMY